MRIENSFIPVRGVGEKTERKLWRNGVTHWDEFDPSFVGSTTGDRIESFIATASEQLDDGNSRFFASEFPSSESWRLYENFRPNTCFFDIETTGLSHHSSVVTTVSLHRDGETTTLVRGDDLTRDALRRELGESDLLVSFNGKRFDQQFLEHEFDLSLDTPHVDLLYPCKRLGLTGGLSAVESELGIGRGGMDISGEDAVRLWYRYEAGDEDALDTLVRYNQYDTRNLETILDHVCDALHDDVFACHLP
ncbi:ribonuclease H-like domain-containing protein [Haladaptatus halobius]|uniref:ribonuclease H-like domain-containing protein n=1 Tax=Haladaptatus halobius TaxID=2884875 RepID=UPI001D09CB9C|nr:ribonuclease H-like domain-containing protein [Haladaptatus halobius]